MFEIWEAIPGVNPQALPASTWEPGHFFVFFSLFKLCITESPKIFKYTFGDLLVITRKGHLTNVSSFIEIHRIKRQRQLQRDPAFKKVDFKKVRHRFSDKSLIL